MPRADKDGHCKPSSHHSHNNDSRKRSRSIEAERHADKLLMKLLVEKLKDSKNSKKENVLESLAGSTRLVSSTAMSIVKTVVEITVDLLMWRKNITETEETPARTGFRSMKGQRKNGLSAVAENMIRVIGDDDAAVLDLSMSHSTHSLFSVWEFTFLKTEPTYLPNFSSQEWSLVEIFVLVSVLPFWCVNIADTVCMYVCMSFINTYTIASVSRLVHLHWQTEIVCYCLQHHSRLCALKTVLKHINVSPQHLP